VEAIFEAYLAAQRRRRPSPLTLKAIRHALGQTQRWLDEHDLAAGELGLLQCEWYFDELLERQAVSTVRRHLAYVRAAHRYGVRHELVERDLTADVRLPRLPDIEPGDLQQRAAANRKKTTSSRSRDARRDPQRRVRRVAAGRGGRVSGGRSSSSVGSSGWPARAASSGSSRSIRP
jgi:site-specific recombinase XerD